MSIRLYSIFTVIILSIALIGCEPDNGSDPDPLARIMASTELIQINDSETAPIGIRVNASGEFTYKVKSIPSWIEVVPSAGELTSEELFLVVYTKENGLEDGLYSGDIVITSDRAGEVTVPIEMYVGAEPVMDVDPTSFRLGIYDADTAISLSNTGTGFLGWSVTDTPNWLKLEPDHGILGEGEGVEVTCSAIRFGLNEGTYQTYVKLASNSVSGQATLNVLLDVPAYRVDIGEYKLLPGSLEAMPYQTQDKAVYVDSLGNELVFVLDIYDLFTSQLPSSLFRYNVYVTGDIVEYRYYLQSKRTYLNNDSLGINMSVVLRTRPWDDDPEARYVADVTQATYQDPGLGSNSNYIVFTHVTDQRTWPSIPWSVFSFDTLEILGEVYQDVLIWDRDNVPTKLYFNYEVGIVAFTEATGKVWRFDRFE